MAMEAQPAATLVLLREAAGAPEMFMQARAATMGFAAGMMVFPGGKVDAGDVALAATPMLRGSAVDAADAAARIAAVRECFEEAGVLLTHGPAIAATEFAAAQPAIAARTLGFADFLARFDQVIDLDALVPFTRWIPPANVAHRRYDTRFYLARCPDGAEAGHDGNEATTSCWISAAEALARADRREAEVIFPTRRNLERLAQFTSIAALIDHARTTPLVTVQPEVRMLDDGQYLCIPEGIGYPVTREALTSALRG
jgi:8-oxo-dGTP pyrophosphatase MutT (NUDIX family)